MDKRRTAMRSFIISEDRDAVERWDSTERGEDRPRKKTTSGDESPFLDIARDFEKSIEVFREAIPFFSGHFLW
jgi:hypothetical protein